MAKTQSPVRTRSLSPIAAQGKSIAPKELDQGDVAGGIDADDHGVVHLAVGHAALHRLAAGLRDVKIGQGVAVGRDDHAGAAALSVGREDRQHAVLRLVSSRRCAGLRRRAPPSRRAYELTNSIPRERHDIVRSGSHSIKPWQWGESVMAALSGVFI